MQKKVTTALVALAVGSLLTACGSPSSSSSKSAGSSKTIKVALIPPTSGALATFGTDAVRGWQIAADQVNAAGGVDGRKIQLIKKSTDATPATTLRVAREATTKDGAKFIGAVMTSTEHGALNAQLAGLGALSFNGLGKDDALTGKDCKNNAFRVVQSNSMDIDGLASSLAKLPGDKWAIQAVDYSTGHDAATTFAKAVQKAGKKVVLQEFAPLNTTDFGSYITKLKSSGADALFAVEYGADGVAFVKQATQFKLPAQFKTILGFNMVSEPLFPALGDSIKGYYNNVGYDVDSTNAINTKFVADYSKKYGTKPYYVPADNYLAAETLFAGIKKAKSADPDKVRDALNDLSFDSVDGKVTMRGADHQLLRSSYLGEVEGSGKNLAFKILSDAAASQTTPAASPDCKL